MPELKITKETFVSVSILLAAIGAASWITAAATNANAKVEALTATSAAGFQSMNTRLSKIESNIENFSHDLSPLNARISVLEAQMKAVQSTQVK